jgi:hypothetical protein
MATLRKNAQARAWDDAKSQLDGFASKCDFKGLKLTTVTQPAFTAHYDMGKSGESATPLIPENITVRAVWKFVWEFEPTPGCRL